MAREQVQSGNKAVAIIPTSKIDALARDMAPFLHMTAEEIAAELIGAVRYMYEREGLETPDGNFYAKKVDA